jgi:hypothetical protein
MAQYLILIYQNEAALNAAPASEIERIQQAHGMFGQRYGANIRGGGRLADSDAATTIRTGDDGSQTITDGMFPETKEVLGGYYVVEADNLDDAIAMAKLVPTIDGGIEVRPLLPS